MIVYQSPAGNLLDLVGSDRTDDQWIVQGLFPNDSDAPAGGSISNGDGPAAGPTFTNRIILVQQNFLDFLHGNAVLGNMLHIAIGDATSRSPLTRNHLLLRLLQQFCTLSDRLQGSQSAGSLDVRGLEDL
jgi:hypothetical protein